MSIETKQLTQRVSIEQSWVFKFGKSINQAKIRLICFPFAGGSASFFHSWQALMPDDVELVAIELPGRASRIREPLINDSNELLNQLEKLDVLNAEKPFAFFGHSMGAYIAFELSRRLRQSNKPQPVHLFLSGRQAPHIKNEKKKIHALPEKEFIQQIASLNGMPQAVLDNPELMELVSPILRADCKLLETWPYKEDEKLNVPITAMIGVDDPAATHNRVERWADLSSENFKLHQFPGDHFFINTAKQAVVDKIVDDLKVN